MWKQTFLFDRYGNRNFDEANTTFEGFDKLCNSNTELCADLRKKLNPAINASDNRISSGQGYSFDSSGNTTRDAGDRKFTYDAENKQVKVESLSPGTDTVTGTIGEYFYDGDGRRVKKVVPSTGEVTIFVYDAASKLIAEYSTIVASTNDAKVAYLTNDHLGSPRINTDANGTVVARHDYHPFGEEIATSQRTLGLGYADDAIRKQFTGYERDIESDLDFAQARMYNPAHGRFTAVDPLLASGMPGNPQTWNRYTYVLNNPLYWVDPTGLIWGKNDDNQVKWFDKKLGKGFSEFTPDAWQYEGTNGRIIQLDANSSNWSVINPVEVVAESNPIQDLVQSTGGALNDSLTGLQIGARNAVTGGVNALTNPLGPAGSMAGVPNPFEIAPLEPGNARQAAYAFIAETGVTAMATAGAGSALAGPASAGSSLSVVPGTMANGVPRTSSVLGHIFRNAEGHVGPATSASQGRFINLVERIANNADNLNPNVLTNFQRTNSGFQGYSQTYRNGQVWAHVRSGRIFDAGVNRVPR